MARGSRDPVRRLLRARGCAEHVVAGGLEGLLENWQGVAAEVERGYEAGLDDYLNDLDGRQILADTLAALSPAPSVAFRDRLEAIDARFRAAVEPASCCLWGESVARRSGWTAARNWWYYSVPRRPGAALAADLKGR